MAAELMGGEDEELSDAETGRKFGYDERLGIREWTI